MTYYLNAVHMYRISKVSRKYSPTPIVKVIVGPDGKEQEELVLLAVNMKKKEGDQLSKKMVNCLQAMNATDEDNYDLAVKVFLIEEGRPANMNNTKDSNAVAILEVGIRYARNLLNQPL